MTLKENIVEYTIQDKDLSLTILNYGATITKLIYNFLLKNKQSHYFALFIASVS